MYCFVKSDKAHIVPDDSVDVANKATWEKFKRAEFVDDLVGTEYQGFEFVKLNARMLNSMVEASAQFFDGADEVITWRDKHPTPVDKNGLPAKR